jgi:hypothetical protein
MGFPWYSQVAGPFLSHARARLYYYSCCVLIQNYRVNSPCCPFAANKARLQTRVSVILTKTFRGLLFHTRHIPEYYLKFVQDCFIPNPCHFILHAISSVTDSYIKYITN